MNASTPAKIVLLFLMILGGWACKSTKPVQDQPADDGIDREAIYWATVDSAKMEFTQADVDFMTGMISHHAQALVMSRLVPSHGVSKKVQRLASRIINSQKDEIATMQQWLRERGEPVPRVHIDGLNLTISGVEDPHSAQMHMPGMLSQNQLQELADTKGPAFDGLFLTYMIQHHSGALTMVDDLFGSNGGALEDAAFKLASDINVDQTTEIARMKRILKELNGA